MKSRSIDAVAVVGGLAAGIDVAPTGLDCQRGRMTRQDTQGQNIMNIRFLEHSTGFVLGLLALFVTSEEQCDGQGEAVDSRTTTGR